MTENRERNKPQQVNVNGVKYIGARGPRAIVMNAADKLIFATALVVAADTDATFVHAIVANNLFKKDPTIIPAYELPHLEVSQFEKEQDAQIYVESLNQIKAFQAQEPMDEDYAARLKMARGQIEKLYAFEQSQYDNFSR